jgi:hypothetical protein
MDKIIKPNLTGTYLKRYVFTVMIKYTLLTTLLIVILLKRLFYNTRFIVFSNGCKYVFMPLTKFIQHKNDELLTTAYILS